MAAVFRIVDVVLAEGVEAVLRFGVALLKRNQQRILSLEFDRLVEFLKDGLFTAYAAGPPAHKAAAGPEYMVDDFIFDAGDITLTQLQLDAYARQYRQQHEADAGVQAELERVRAHNAALAAQVAELRGQLAALNAAQLGIADALSRGKMEAARLYDRNETLQEENTELKLRLNSVPDELEQKYRDQVLQAETRARDTAQRNRLLDSRIGELERESMSLKMQHASLADSHSSLVQRWRDMRKHFDDV